jgi:hypothetical protein
MKCHRWLVVWIALVVACATGASPPQLAPVPPETPFTFVVVGDNRGDSTGKQYPVFLEIVKAINEASPSLVLNTGDMINGYAGEDEALWRRQWKGYREAIASLTAPVFHAPGNHDVFDQPSARLWKELWGPTYYAFDYGCARFIALDTETEKSRLGKVQFKWLGERLKGAGKRHVFLFFHKPLFPVDGHIGSSLDKYPGERDRLHQLFVQYRRVIKGVFQGHEHMYNFEKLDGVPYYIIGGGGAELYMPPGLGGFHHFVLVSVTADKVSAEVRKVGGKPEPPKAVMPVVPGALLEGWEHGLFWYTWDHSARKEVTREHATEGKQGLKVWFDFSQYKWPLLYVPLYPPWDLRRADVLTVDVYVPKDLTGDLSVTLIIEGKKTHAALPVFLKLGWNTVTIGLNATWLPKEVRSVAGQLQWILSTDSEEFAGWVVFDNFKAGVKKIKAQSEATGRGQQSGAIAPVAPTGLLESWEDRLLWGAWNDTVMQEVTPEFVTQGKRGLKVRFDFAQCNRPLLYAPLNPLWDLSRVGTLTMDVYAPEDVAGALRVNLVIARKEKKYQAPAVSLKPGWNKVIVDLNGTWLSKQARSAAEQVEWILSTDNKKLAGWAVFDNFRAEAWS